MNYTKLKVVRVKDITPDIFELVLEGKGIKHKPGDCMLLMAPNNEARPFFIASGIAEPWMRFLIKRCSSEVSTYLSSLQPGKMVKVQPEPVCMLPHLMKAPDDVVFIASDVGIAPILSYLSTYPTAKTTNISYLIDNEGVNVEWLKGHHKALIYTDKLAMESAVIDEYCKLCTYYVVGYAEDLSDIVSRLKGKKIKRHRLNDALFSKSN